MKAEDFQNIIEIIIDNFEGGYFHPNMLKDGRLKDPKGLMSAGPGRKASAETMYGFDRVNGASLYTGSAGKEFWKLIDDSGAKDKWKWNYKGGDLAPKLKALAGLIMYPQWDKYAKKYFSPKAKELVEQDKKMLLHFGYALWNGEGYFSRWAKTINDSVAGGITDLNALSKIAIESRTKSTNVLIKQAGDKLEKLANSLYAMASKAVEVAKENPVKTALILPFFLFFSMGVVAVGYVNKDKIKEWFSKKVN